VRFYLLCFYGRLNNAEVLFFRFKEKKQKEIVYGNEKKNLTSRELSKPIGVWQGVAMDFLKFHPGSPCLTLLHSAGGPPLKQPYGHFRGGLPVGWVAYGRLLPLWTPHAVRLLANPSDPQQYKGLSWPHCSAPDVLNRIRESPPPFF
jgi:hypothetical protein